MDWATHQWQPFLAEMPKPAMCSRNFWKAGDESVYLLTKRQAYAVGELCCGLRPAVGVSHATWRSQLRWILTAMLHAEKAFRGSSRIVCVWWFGAAARRIDGRPVAKWTVEGRMQHAACCRRSVQSVSWEMVELDDGGRHDLMCCTVWWHQ